MQWKKGEKGNSSETSLAGSGKKVKCKMRGETEGCKKSEIQIARWNRGWKKGENQIARWNRGWKKGENGFHHHYRVVPPNFHPPKSSPVRGENLIELEVQ